MRGLPYRATEDEIHDFFQPVKLLAVRILMNNDNRPSGEADVAFYTHDDAAGSMNKNRQHLGNSQISWNLEGILNQECDS